MRVIEKKIINEEKVNVGDELIGADKKSVIYKKKGKVVRISGGDMAIVDFGNGDTYGIVLRRIKDGKIYN